MTWVDLEVLGWAVAVVASGWLPPRRWQAPAVSLVTLAFMLVHAPVSAALLAALALCSFLILARDAHATPRIATAVGAVVATWAFFKLGGGPSFRGEASDLTVPLGLSYYGMRIIHWSVERYKGNLREHGLEQYLCYLFFFPILFAGPISGFPEFARDLRRRRFDTRAFSLGLERVLTGYAKVVVLGNYLISIKFGQYLLDEHAAGTAVAEYLDCLRYAANLYVQFSGYSDIAIGLAAMLGFRIAENFDWPFLATNIGEFWQRWHMTLTGWCRAYVYLPVAAMTRRPALGTLTAMLVLGIWHEPSARFVVWGLYHGLGIVVWQKFRAAWPEPLEATSGARIARRACATFVTFQFVVVSFAIAKEASLAEALAVFRTLLGGG